MKRPSSKLLYLIFPLVGLLLALLVGEERAPLRVLLLIVFSVLGALAAEANFRPRDLVDAVRAAREAPRRLGNARYAVAALLMLAALVLMLLSAFEFRPGQVDQNDFTSPVLLALAGAVALWLSMGYAAPPVQIVSLTSTPLTPSNSRFLLTLVGALLMLLSGELAGRLVIGDVLGRVSMQLQAVIFYGGIALLTLGLSGARWPGLPGRETLRSVLSWRDWLRFPRAEVLLVLALFAGAFVIRVWNLELGLRASFDEALSLDGVGHYYGGVVGLVDRPSGYIPTLLFSQWQGELIRLLGHTVTTLRLTSVIIGSLTVVVTYFLGRDLFKDRALGVVAAVVLMTFPPHIQFSRIALLHIADPLFGTLALWFLVRALETNRRLHWVLMGVSLGMTQYFFEAGRLFYAPLVVTWLVLALLWFGGRALLHRVRSTVSQPAALPWKGMILGAMAFVLVAVPVYYAAFSSEQEVNPRLAESGGLYLITDLLQDGLTDLERDLLLQRLFFPYLVYVHQPELAEFYGGNTPLILVYVVPFFLLGTAYAIRRARTPLLILLLWVIGTAVVNALLRDSAVYARWHVVFPAVALLVALALRYLLPWVVLFPLPSALEGGVRLHALHLRAAVVLTGLVVVALAAAQTWYYHAVHSPALERQIRLTKGFPDTFDAALRSVDIPDNTDTAFVGLYIPDVNIPASWINYLTTANPNTLRYYTYDGQGFTQDVIDAMDPQRSMQIFVDPALPNAIALIQSNFDCQLENTPYPMDPPDKAFLRCFVPAPGAAGQVAND